MVRIPESRILFILRDNFDGEEGNGDTRVTIKLRHQRESQIKLLCVRCVIPGVGDKIVAGNNEAHDR